MQRLNSEIAFNAFLTSHSLCGVYYSTVECGVCRTVKPQIETLFKTHKMPLNEVSINEMRALAGQQLILKSPTLIVYENGKEISRQSGFIDLARMDRNLTLMAT